MKFKTILKCLLLVTSITLLVSCRTEKNKKNNGKDKHKNQISIFSS